MITSVPVEPAPNRWQLPSPDDADRHASEVGGLIFHAFEKQALRRLSRFAQDVLRRSRRDRTGLRFFIFLEVGRRKFVPLQEFVEIGAIALCHACRLGDITARNAQQADQVVVLEAAPRFFQRLYSGVFAEHRFL